MSNYKLIQLTNKNVPEVAINGLLPLGNITRRVDCKSDCPTFTVSTSGADTVTLSSAGYYRITYSLTALATAADALNVTLLANGSSVYSVSETPAAAGDSVNLSLIYTVRVFPQCDNVANNNPMTIQFQTSGAITSGTSNLIIERVY